MKVSCPSCTAKYSIADEKVRNRLAKIRCRKCGTTIVIDGKTDPPTIQAADAAVGRPDEYTVDISDSDQRQMTVDQIVLAYNDGVITADTFVWKEGMGDWETLASVTELNDALHRAAALAGQPPQTAGGTDYGAPSQAGAAYAAPTYAAAGAIESPFASSGYGAVSATPPSDPPHAMPTVGSPLTGGLFSGGVASSRAATRTGVGGDLFGGLDHIGGETDLATSAADVLPAQPNTGARNESSVLFSLSALTAGGGDVSVKPKPQTSSEDSGLIDLAALAAQAGKSTSREANSVSAMPVPLTAPLGAPLIGGSTSPLGDGSAHAVPNRNGLYIGGGIAVAAMVLGGVFLLREPPPPALQPIAIPTALPSAPIEVAAPAADEEDQAEGEKADAEKADGEDEAEADEKDTAKKVATTTKRTYPRTRKSTSKSTSSSKTTSSTSAKSDTEKSSATTTKKAPAKKKNNCNCKPGDLMCAMKCSAK